MKSSLVSGGRARRTGTRSPAGDLFGHPPPGAVCQRQTGRGDPTDLLGPCPGRATRGGTDPPSFAPHQPRGTAKRRQIDEFDNPTILRVGHTIAAGAARTKTSRFDVDPQRAAGVVDDADDVHVGQTDQELAHANRVVFHRGSRIWRRREPPDSLSPCAASGMPYSPLKSEAPAKCASAASTVGAV